MIAEKTLLITGGAGFIGSHLVERLAPANHVRVLDNLHRDALSGSGLGAHPHVTLVRGDVTDLPAVREAVRDADMVIHLAAIAGVDSVVSDPVRTMEVSLQGTMNVLRAATEHGRCQRFVDVSTSEVFGRMAYKAREADPTTLGAAGEPRWTYAVAKLAAEHLVLAYGKQYGLPACTIRPFNVYGPRQVGMGAVHEFIVRALRGEDLVIHDDGSQLRAWCYVDDLVDGMLLCLERAEAVGHVFNLGNPRATLTIHHLARAILELTGSRSALRHMERHAVDVALRVPEIRKATELLGYQPRVDLDEGLRRTIAWYREKIATDKPQGTGR